MPNDPSYGTDVLVPTDGQGQLAQRPDPERAAW